VNQGRWGGSASWALASPLPTVAPTCRPLPQNDLDMFAGSVGFRPLSRCSQAKRSLSEAVIDQVCPAARPGQRPDRAEMLSEARPGGSLGTTCATTRRRRLRPEPPERASRVKTRQPAWRRAPTSRSAPVKPTARRCQECRIVTGGDGQREVESIGAEQAFGALVLDGALASHFDSATPRYRQRERRRRRAAISVHRASLS